MHEELVKITEGGGCARWLSGTQPRAANGLPAMPLKLGARRGTRELGLGAGPVSMRVRIKAETRIKACQEAPRRVLHAEGYKQRVINMWQGRGASYDANDTFHYALAAQLVDLADIAPGNAVLDAATGTGMAALLAAERAGEAGRVLGVDISESMLSEVGFGLGLSPEWCRRAAQEQASSALPCQQLTPIRDIQARRKADQLGLSNVELLSGDVETVELEEATFDRILCSSALLYFQDLQGTLGRFCTWLKPGGRLCFNTPQARSAPLPSSLQAAGSLKE